MAQNVVLSEGNQIAVAVAAGIESGDPGLFGGQPFVALTDRDATSGEATVKFNGVATFSLTGEIAAGDPIYIDGVAGDLSTTSTGTFYGVALDAVAAATTADCRVRIGGIEPAGS